MAGAGWLIINPQAGQKAGLPTNAAGPAEAQAALERAGLAVDVHLTEYAGHATELARAAAQVGVELVIAAGGDGTVREVAAGLLGTPTVLGILPLGSVMNTARALNIPRDLEQAAAVIAQRRIIAMDVGRASTASGEAYFLEAAGVGVDAGLFRYSSMLDHGRWDSLGPLLRFLVRYRAHPARIVVDGQGRLARALTITIAIGPFLGPALATAPDAKVDDRQFDVVIWAGMSQLALLGHLLALASGKRTYHSKAEHLRGRRVEIDGVRRRLPVHADGEALGRTPATFELLPGALRVLAGESPSGEPSAVTGRR